MTENKILEEHKNERTSCSVWSRVMGYYRPMDQYNKGKLQEAKDRKCFKISDEKICKCDKKAA